MKKLNFGSKRKSVQNSKSRYDSKSIVRITLSLVIAIVAFVGALAFESYYLSDKAVETVVVAKKDVEKGTVIDDNNYKDYFQTIEVNATLKTENTYTDLTEVRGKCVAGIDSGEIVTTNAFSATALSIEDIKDPVEYTFTVATITDAVAGTIRAGDICDILIINTNSDETVAKKIMENAYIVATYDSSGNEIASSDTTSQSLTFQIYVPKAEEATLNELLSMNSVTVTKIAEFNEDEVLKQESFISSVSSEGTDATTEEKSDVNTTAESTTSSDTSKAQEGSTQWAENILGTTSDSED